MKNRILIVEPDTEFATRLAAALEKGEYEATIVRNVRDACLILVQQAQDLAFVPAQSDDGLLRALLSLQPDLPLVGIVPAPNMPLPQAQRARLKTLVSKSNFAVELPLVLEAILQKPVSSLFLEVENQPTQTVPAIDMGRILAALQQMSAETDIATVFAQGRSVLAFSGDLTNEQSSLIATRCYQTWHEGEMTAQMQFYRLPGRVGEHLLYSRPVGDGYFLHLVTVPTTPLSMLRRQAEQLQPLLVELIGMEVTLAAAPPTAMPSPPSAPAPTPSSHTYAILWRSREDIPDFLHIPLRRALERIAKTNACILTHFDVTEQYVHVVVACPPGRNGTWAAHLFKNGSERELQTQFQVRTTFWSNGHYATPSIDPLSHTELNLFLQRPLAA